MNGLRLRESGPSGWRVGEAVLLSTVVVLGSLGWLLWPVEPPVVTPSASPAPAAWTAVGTWTYAPPAPLEQAATTNAAPHTMPDPVGGAPDLRRVYDQYVGSADVGQRRLAARAFDACIPTFLPSAAQTPSPEPLIQALPADQRTAREAAYRALFARCSRFLSERRDTLEGMRLDFLRDSSVPEPGQRAQEALLAGRLDQVEELVAWALSGADPASVEHLSGLAVRLAQTRNAADAFLVQTARAIDAALPLVACDLGLDCSVNSLRALQMCAVEGLCEGSFGARAMARQGSEAMDPALLQQQHARLLALIRKGRPLTSADLLP